MRTGETVASYLNPKKYDVIPVEISKAGKWLTSSPVIKQIASKIKTQKVSTSDLVPVEKDEKAKVDVALLALHGPGGEDGTIQGMLELLKIPYTCSGVLASALAMDKDKTKRLVALEGILVAPHFILRKSEYNKNPGRFLAKIKGKVVIKPNRIGSSLGVTITDKKEKIKNGIKDAFIHDEEIMIEAYISGRELTVPVLGNRDPKAMPVVEIIPKRGSKFFDFRAKYDPLFCDEIVPAEIPKNLANKLQEISVIVHKLLDCRGVTRSDFIVTKTHQIYFLEINTIPGMTANSLVPKSALAAGMSYSQFLDKLIQLARQKD